MKETVKESKDQNMYRKSANKAHIFGSFSETRKKIMKITCFPC